MAPPIGESGSASGRTDGQTDRRNCDSICALTAYAVARNNGEMASRKSESNIVQDMDDEMSREVESKDTVRMIHIEVLRSTPVAYQSLKRPSVSASDK